MAELSPEEILKVLGIEVSAERVAQLEQALSEGEEVKEDPFSNYRATVTFYFTAKRQEAAEQMAHKLVDIWNEKITPDRPSEVSNIEKE